MDSQDYKFWNNKIKLLDNLTLTGYSRSTKRTGFIIPELDFFLDAGVYTTQPAKYIFITHTHSDHIYELPRIINYSNMPIIYVPESSKKYVEKYIDSLLQLTTNNSKINYKKYCSIIGIKDLDILELKHQNHEYIIEPIKCDHGIASIGYGFSERRKKIKEEYKDLSQEEIIKLKKEDKNIEISEKKIIPLFAYICDSSYKVFLEEEMKLQKYNIIITECTYFKEEDILEADERKHIHWLYLEEYIKNNLDKRFILIHFSLRYNKKDLQDFNNIIKNKYNNVELII